MTTNEQEQERFVNDMARYAKTHADWKNLQPESAVRSVLWVLVSDKTAFDDLCSVWAAEPNAESYRRCDRCEGTDFLSSALNGDDEPVWLCRDCISNQTGNETSFSEDRVVDLMAALEQSIAEAKAARTRAVSGTSRIGHDPRDTGRSGPCSSYTARSWTPGAERPEDARCVNCGEDHGPSVGGSESRVAPGQPADGERSAPPTDSVLGSGSSGGAA